MATQHGGARHGAGRKSKSLLEHVLAGSFRLHRHRRLLSSDSSLIEAATRAPEDAWLRRLAEIQVIARDGNGVHPAGARSVVEWFADSVRAMHAADVSPARAGRGGSTSSGHRIWIDERVEDGWLVAEARSAPAAAPMVLIRIASSEYCPHCVGTVLRGVLERYEGGAAGTT